MSSYMAQFVLPVPVAAVAPAAAMAVSHLGYRVTQQTEFALQAKGSWLRLMGSRVTIDLAVGGTDGAAAVAVRGSNFGIGPIQTSTCQNEVSRFCEQMTLVLKAWGVWGANQTYRTQQAPAASPAAPLSSGPEGSPDAGVTGAEGKQPD